MVIVNGTKPQEIVQFIIQYRYISKDGREAPVDTYDINNSQSRASFSRIEFKSSARKELMIVRGIYLVNRRHY
jgi:hypothetical protein